MEYILFKWLKNTSCTRSQNKKNHILLDRWLSENRNFTIKMNGNKMIACAVSILQVSHTLNVVIYVHTRALWLFGTFDCLKNILISFSGETFHLDIRCFCWLLCSQLQKAFIFIEFSLQSGRISKQILQNSARACL